MKKATVFLVRILIRLLSFSFNQLAYLSINMRF